MEIFNINNIEEVVAIGDRFKDSWFRGHSKTGWELVPKLFRKVEHGGYREKIINRDPVLPINSVGLII